MIAGLLTFLAAFLLGVLASEIAILIFPLSSNIELQKKVGPVHDPAEPTPCELSVYKY
ncbi:MAG TPA: hypothetical protein VEV84_11360 [Pyrinomonadaceae bacterium]|nr:hypothetical protein [Pyrinomonadaceae bacterium]